MSKLGEESRELGWHPLVWDWFEESYGSPTDIQSRAWALISQGRHALITAATGSGKTLAAFLWAINRLASGEWSLGQTRVLYISPLKALNNDIRRNLLEPLAALQDRFEQAGETWPEIRVETRSGDTSQTDRRRLLRHPPEILITTPESLNLMLASRDGRSALVGIETVILDEIHAVVASKRGVYLMTAVERLAHLRGEFQRIALSATVRPMERVAAFVGGRQWTGGRWEKREVALAKSETQKRYQIQATFPADTQEEADEEDSWKPIVREIKCLVNAHGSTLIFVNSRRLCESLTHKINQDEASPLAYSHHGSLSREIRAAVEERMKRGELKAIVATNSLEMGIDIGALDQVILVQCPGLISSAIQKIGRAGHQVGAVSRATLFPSHARDFLEAAVLSRAIRERDIEAVRPIERPLDVLAQVIVAMLAGGPMDRDDMLRILRSCDSYRELTEDQFELVLAMLSGRYAATRLRELKPRIAVDREENSVTLRKGALMAFYFSGGVIPDRGYFHLRVEGTGARIGELDEEFVWERSIGDSFTLGTQSWRIERITYNDVFVTPSQAGGPMPPFWRSEEFNRDFHYSQRIGEFLEWADERLGQSDFEERLGREYRLDAVAARNLAKFLRRQKAATKATLPHRHHVLAELIDAAPQGAPGKQLVLHTHWGGKVNRPFALALDAAWEEAFGHRTEVYVSNDCVVVMLTGEVAAEEALGLVRSDNVDTLLRRRLEGSGFFGAKFRECAGTALLIARQKPNQRLPLWLSRMRSKKLLDSVRKLDDFPMMLEAWRSCLQDEFDMEGLKTALSELETGAVELGFARTGSASPFAKTVAWRQINDQYMYDSDKPLAEGGSRLREDLLKSLALGGSEIPRVSMDVVREYESKRQRVALGYAPSDELELGEFVAERILLEEEEWQTLLQAARRDSGNDELGLSLQRIKGVGGGWHHPSEMAVARRLAQPPPDPEVFLQWLSYYGLYSLERLRHRFAWTDGERKALLEDLQAEQRIFVGPLSKEGEETYVCEAENFETLLRMQRARSRPAFEAKPLEELAPFLAAQQGLVGSNGGMEALASALTVLSGCPGRAEWWEESWLPARVPNYQTNWLDSLLAEGEFAWAGCGDGSLAIGYAEEIAQGTPEGEGAPWSEEERAAWEFLSANRGGRFSFGSLLSELQMEGPSLEAALWSLVWRGKVGNDAFAAARRGLLGGFRLADERRAAPEALRGGAARRWQGRPRRRAGLPGAGVYPGNWYLIEDYGNELDDEVASLEWEKEKARLLLDRYGIVFRELLQREARGYRWSEVFKALRLMELAGEVLTGQFFEGIPGLQFISQGGFRRLRRQGAAKRPIFWHSATDPASLCGLSLEALQGKLPRRLASNYCVWRGSELVLVVNRQGRELDFRAEPSDPDLIAIVEPLRHLLRRSFNPLRLLHVETINGQSALASPYIPFLETAFSLHRTHKHLALEGMRELA